MCVCFQVAHLSGTDGFIRDYRPTTVNGHRTYVTAYVCHVVRMSRRTYVTTTDLKWINKYHSIFSKNFETFVSQLQTCEEIFRHNCPKLIGKHNSIICVLNFRSKLL